MELKHAAAVCLIAFFSATLVVLIARALDLQAASRLEPQLARIVEELEAIRKQGLIAAPAGAAAGEAFRDGLVVYYFHGNTRCPTCQAIESQAYEVVHGDFAGQLQSGALAWKILNYEDSSAAGLAEKFDIIMPVVVLARMEGGEIKDWSRLDRVWALVGDQPAFAAFVHDEIGRMLGSEDADLAGGTSSEAAEIPLPDADSESLDIPVPVVPDDLPIP